MRTREYQTRRLAIFAKAPIAGCCKTRLIPAVGEVGAAAIQRRLLHRTLNVATAGRASTELWTALNATHPFFWRCRTAFPITLRHQSNGNLGQRMSSAFADMLVRSQSALIIGADCPVLSTRAIEDAFAALEFGADVVVTPADDGGYVLVGMKRPCPRLFRGITWSSHLVMEQTRRRARRLNLRMTELDTLWDVDRPAELQRARRLGWL